MPAKINMTGERYGRLLVVEQNKTDKRGEVWWLCRCDCGKTVAVRGSYLRTGATKSCGCLHQDSITKHGMSDTRLYSIWHAMNQRCSNKNNERYDSYGGRGITVTPEWRNFESFRDWALANDYQDDLTIDRIDNDGNYCPENCRWITNKAQQNNRRNNRIIEFNGEKKNIQEWAEKCAINPRTIRKRLQKGWTIERALTEPTKIQKKGEGNSK